MAPILSTITPIVSAPNISPAPSETIANIDNLNYSFSLISFGNVFLIIGNNNPVYTAILIPVHPIYGNTILILFVNIILNIDFISSLKPFGPSVSLLVYGSFSTNDANLLNILILLVFTSIGFLKKIKEKVATEAIPAIIK